MTDRRDLARRRAEDLQMRGGRAADMTDRRALARLIFAVVCGTLAVLLGTLFLRMEQLEPHVDSWLRDSFVPWLARKNILVLELKPLDVKGIVLVLDFLLGMYAIILALLSVRLFEGPQGERISCRVQWIALLLVAAGVAPILHFTYGPEGLALALSFKGILAHLAIVGIYLGAVRRLSVVQAALLGVLVVILTTVKLPELDRRLDGIIKQAVKQSES